MNGHDRWDKLKHFNPDATLHCWGDTHKIDRSLLVMLDAFRESIGCPLIIVSAWHDKERDVPGSLQHCEGRAADFMVFDYKGHVLDLFFQITQHGFSGIGIYQKLQSPKHILYAFHVDIGLSDNGMPRKYWFCHETEGGVREFFPLTMSVLAKFKVVK